VPTLRKTSPLHDSFCQLGRCSRTVTQSTMTPFAECFSYAGRCCGMGALPQDFFSRGIPWHLYEELLDALRYLVYDIIALDSCVRAEIQAPAYLRLCGGGAEGHWDPVCGVSD